MPGPVMSKTSALSMRETPAPAAIVSVNPCLPNSFKGKQTNPPSVTGRLTVPRPDAPAQRVNLRVSVSLIMCTGGAYRPFLPDISTPQYEPAHIAPPRPTLFIRDTYPRCHNGAQLIKQRGLDH